MRVNPDGNRGPGGLMVLGEAPGWEEQQQGRGYVGKAGQQFWADLKRHTGLTREDFWVSNVVKDGLPNNRDPKPAEIAAALPELIDEILAIRPHVIVATGGFAARAILGSVTRLADVHGIPHEAEIAGHRCLCHPTYHPAAGLHNKGTLAAFAFDLIRLGWLLDGRLDVWAPSVLPATSEWLLASPKSRGGAFPQGSRVALDTEGWPDKPWGLSLTTDGRRAHVVRADSGRVLAWLSEWLPRQRLVLHNGIHDLPVLRAMGINIGDYDDTQVLGYHDMMRTGSGVLEAESQNLGTLAYRECGLRLRELSELPGVDFETQTIPYSDEIRDYAGMDVIATWRLFNIYEQRGLTEHQPYQIDMGQVAMVERMMRNGLPFDVDAATDYYIETRDELDGITEKLKAQAKRFGIREFNPGSHPQVRDIVTRRIGLRTGKRTKGGKASTSEKALAMHQHHPFVADIQKYRELKKREGTYIKPLLEELL